MLLGRSTLKPGAGLRKAGVKVPRKLRSALRRGAALTLRVTAIDAAGNRTVVQRKVRVT